MIDHSQTQLIAAYLLLLLNLIITIKYKKKSFKRPPSTWPAAKPVTLSATGIKLKLFKTKPFLVQQNCTCVIPLGPNNTVIISSWDSS